jgi:hypothetical protein
MSQSYDYWRDAALAGTYTPLSPEALAEIYTATCRYGSGNAWAGTSGVLCDHIRQLLREVEWLRQAMEGD